MIAPANSAKVVSCPTCGTSITLRALGQSVMAACPSCRTQLDVSRPDIKIIKSYREKVSALLLPLGARGSLKGQSYEVIGAMQRSVSGYRWTEYLLFNPYVGFRWLVYDSGHWNFGEMIKDVSKITIGEVLQYEDRYYRKFQEGNPKVEWVIGEFYWRVAVGDTVRSSDYVSPPYMLSLEKADGEFTWTQLEYIEPAEIHVAFGVQVKEPTTVAPNQPNPVGQSWRAAQSVFYAALAAALIVQGVTISSSHERERDLGPYEFGPGKPEQQVFGPVTLTESRSLNELVAGAPLDNSWVELNCSLVNAQTGETYEFTNAFSFYSGRDSDGAWSEGKNHGESLITEIPAGTYNLVVEGASGNERGLPLTQDVHLELQQDVVPWRNFLLAMLVILSYPAMLLWRRSSFEKQRWADSDFGPSSDDE